MIENQQKTTNKLKNNINSTNRQNNKLEKLQ